VQQYPILFEKDFIKGLFNSELLPKLSLIVFSSAAKKHRGKTAIEFTFAGAAGVGVFQNYKAVTTAPSKIIKPSAK
jgi:hypothetical protein